MLLNRIIPCVLSLCAVVPTGSFIPLVPAPTIVVAVKIPVTIAPEACAWTLTLPAESFSAVASIPVKLAPLPEKLVAVITPVALIWFTSNPAECKFCVWYCKPCECPSVNAVPTFTVSVFPLIVVELEPKVTMPVNVAWPFGSIVTPLPTLIPSLNVPTPTESTFLTSSYVNVPPILTFPEKVPELAVSAPVLTALANVATPATLTLSKFVWPSMSISELKVWIPV